MYNKIIFAALLFGIFGCSTNEPSAPIVPEPEESIYKDCLIPTAANSLEVVTWNLEHYPLSESTLTEVKDIVLSLDADVISLQEISSLDVFETLVSELEGWQGSLAVSGNLNVGFLYKTSEVELIDPLFEIYTDNSSPFPRAPAVIKIKHALGDIHIIDIHLKCCGGEDNVARRMEASRLLKEYIDTTLPSEKVIIAGDFNDEIFSEDGTERTFDNFIVDSDNYLFADMDIAMGSPSGWSYPSWPSHIDHILITNEFFSHQISVETLNLKACNLTYNSKVSDHRPVIMKVE